MLTTNSTLNVHFDHPQYFEAHGTETPTGDPLEAAAIHQAFFGDDNAKEYCKGSELGSTEYPKDWPVLQS